MRTMSVVDVSMKIWANEHWHSGGTCQNYLLGVRTYIQMALCPRNLGGNRTAWRNIQG